MRKTLEHLSNDVARIEGDNIYRAINDLKEVIQKIIELLDIALPQEVED